MHFTYIFYEPLLFLYYNENNDDISIKHYTNSVKKKHLGEKKLRSLVLKDAVWNQSYVTIQICKNALIRI